MLGWGTASVAVAATAMVLTGIALVVFRRGSAAVATLGGFLIVRGWLNGWNLLEALRGYSAADQPWFFVVKWYLSVLLPVAVVAFALHYPPDQDRRARRWGTRVLIGVSAYILVGMAALLSVRGLSVPYGDIAWLALSLPFIPFVWVIPTYALVSLGFARHYVHARAPEDRTTFLLLAVGFATDAGYLGAQFGADLLLGLTRRTITMVPWTLAVVPVLLAAGLIAWDGERRRGGQRVKALAVSALLVPIVVGGASSVLYAPGVAFPDVPLVQFFDALFLFAMPALLVYGLLKHRIFGIDLKLKWGLQQGTVVAILSVAYVATSLVGRVVLSAEDAQVAGAVLTGLLLFALAPLQGLGQRVSSAILPAVEDTPSYRVRRKVEVYRTAMEDAMAGTSELAPRDEARLTRLRATLGLSDLDHDLVLASLLDRPAPSAPALGPGSVIADRYEVLRTLGAGGQGVAHLALDSATGDQVVLKAIPADRDPSQALVEIEALAAIDHAHVLELRGVEGTEQGLVLVMDYARGGTLADRLARGPPLTRPELRALAEGLLSGLEAVHGAGLVHRDVKPSNVFRMEDGRWVLGDLGVVHQTDPQATLRSLTVRGQPGTAGYMSPEQARDQPLDRRSDLFSAGLVLFEAATGEPLIPAGAGDSAIEVRMRVASWQGLDTEASPLPAGLAQVLSAALARAPRDRFGDAASMRSALAAALVDDRPRPSTPVPPADPRAQTTDPTRSDRPPGRSSGGG